MPVRSRRSPQTPFASSPTRPATSSVPAFDFAAFGESGVRLAAADGRRLENAPALEVHIVGAEGNVAAALAGLGRKCAWASALPDAPLGRRVAREYRARGIDVSNVVWRKGGGKSERTALFFTEAASSPLPARVVYDRAHSAVCGLSPDEVDWDSLLDARVLHLTGITPALSESCRRCALEAARRARRRGALVSFDLNYRAQLWPPSRARRALAPLLRAADVVFCPRADAARVLGLEGDAADAARRLAEMCGARWATVSDGGGDIVGWSEGKLRRQRSFSASALDRVGAGDALTAGVLDGILDGDFGSGLVRGAALAAAAMGQRGDIVSVSREELNAAMESGDGGGVAR